MLGTLTPNSSSSFTFQSRRIRMHVFAAVAIKAAPVVNKKSLYEVRVRRDALQIEIKTAYRTLAKLYHPDARSRFMDSSSIASSSTDGRDFLEIQNAYATLSDPDARSAYDLNLNANLSSRSNTASVSGLRGPGGRARRWETDQCW